MTPHILLRYQKNEIPINYSLSVNCNERETLVSLLHFLKKNDVLIVDGGHYSIELLTVLNKIQCLNIFLD